MGFTLISKGLKLEKEEWNNKSFLISLSLLPFLSV